jgi:hypothetical protein
MRLRGHARLWMHRNGGAALGRDPRSRTLRCQGTVTRGNAAIRDVLRRQGRAKPGSARQKQSRALPRQAKALLSAARLRPATAWRSQAKQGVA